MNLAHRLFGSSSWRQTRTGLFVFPLAIILAPCALTEPLRRPDPVEQEAFEKPGREMTGSMGGEGWAPPPLSGGFVYLLGEGYLKNQSKLRSGQAARVRYKHADIAHHLAKVTGLSGPLTNVEEVLFTHDPYQSIGRARVRFKDAIKLPLPCTDGHYTTVASKELSFIVYTPREGNPVFVLNGGEFYEKSGKLASFLGNPDFSLHAFSYERRKNDQYTLRAVSFGEHKPNAPLVKRWMSFEVKGGERGRVFVFQGENCKYGWDLQRDSRTTFPRDSLTNAEIAAVGEIHKLYSLARATNQYAKAHSVK